jgi:YbbR domain-containing protein
MTLLDRKSLVKLWQTLRPLFDRERLWQALTRNISLKLLSLLIAFGLWAFVNFGERDAEESLRVALELRNIPGDLMITSPRVDFIDVRVVGPRTLLGRIDRNRLSIGLDLNGVRPGPAVFRVDAESLNLPRGVKVVRINPAQVTLELERVAEKSVPVRLRLRGKPPPDLQVEDTEVSPASVQLSGPESYVRRIDAVNTEPYDLSDAEAGTIEEELPLEPVGEYMSLSATRVAAQIRVEEIEVTREFDRVPVHVRNTTYRFRVRPENVRLTLRGPKRLLGKLEPNQVPVYIDAGREGPGTHSVQPDIDLPTGVELVSREPQSVSLTLWTQKRRTRAR